MSKCQKPSHCSHILCLREWAGEVRYQTQKMHPWGHIFRVQESSAFGVGRWWQAENPKTSIHARFGGSGGSGRQRVGLEGGGGSRQAEPRKQAVVLAFRVGRMVVAAAAGRGQQNPKNEQSCLFLVLGGWWWQREPRNDHECSFR